MTLANVFMLAHAIVPHYHHDGIVCFNVNEHQQEILHQQECGHHHSENDIGHSELEHCNLQYIIERTGTSIDEDMSSFSVYLSTLECACFLCYDNSFVSDQLLLNGEKYYDTYTNYYKTPYTGSHFGLRAPPMI